MTTLLTFSAVWLVFALWQSTLCLGVPLLLVHRVVKTPWRAHVLLCTGIFSAVLAPTLSTGLAFHNGGISPNILSGVSGVLFVAGMLSFFLLLTYGVMTSRRLMFHARPFPDRESQEALLAHARVLQHVSLPVLFTSDRVKSPTVWCWGLHPAVLLPDELTARLPAEERDAVFLHELAHITRRDHLAALLCRLSGLLLFWHPLWWLALGQSDLLADEACDLLVLSRGTVSPGDYSGILLKLAAGEKPQPAFQFLSRKEKMMKRIDTILDFAERFGDRPNLAPTGTSRLWSGAVISLALLLCVGLAFCQERKPITPDKAMMMGYVEDFFENNARDITMRKSLEWGEVQTDDEGNRTIRYKFEALIWDKDKLIFNSDFTFDKDGNYVNMVNVEGFPQLAEKPDVTTLEGVKKLVEKFFSQNFRDITARKTVRWGELEKHEDGSVSLDYRYEATIWDKDVIVEERRFTFDQDGKFISCDRTDESPKAAEKAIGIEALQQRPVNKKVSDFKDGIDLSTPEAAYATFNKIMASKDKDMIAQLEKYDANRTRISQHEIDSIANMPDDNAEAIKTAEILKACVYDDKVAIVIAKLGEGNSPKPYDVRWLRKVDDKWLHSKHERFDSPDEAITKFVQNTEKEVKKDTDADELVMSLEKFLKIEGLKRYPVKKRIADFPANTIDLSTPEAAYATQKNLIVSQREDKLEQILNMTVGRPKISDIPEHERKMKDEKVSDDWAKTYREQFVVFEVFVLEDKYAFVFGLRLFDMLYDGNFFRKDGDEWLNMGNDQSKNAEDIGRRVQQTLSRYAKTSQILRDLTTEAATVEGIVTMEGMPLADATVVFIPRDAMKRPESCCAAITDADGKFSLVQSSASPMKEIPIGEYRVVIDKKVVEDGEVQRVVMAMYANEATTPLAATVEPGKNRFDFELTSK